MFFAGVLRSNVDMIESEFGGGGGEAIDTYLLELRSFEVSGGSPGGPKVNATVCESP